MVTRHFTNTRWPERELEIRRRSAGDPGFQAVLSDYEEACEAYRRWTRTDPPDHRKVADYRTIIRELEEEIEKHLATP